MPPGNQTQYTTINTDHMLPEGHHGRAGKESSGPIVGIIIIVLLAFFGALYFWGALLNQKQNPPAYIPAENSTEATQ